MVMVNRGWGVFSLLLPSLPAIAPPPPVFQADPPRGSHCLTSTKLFARDKAARVRH